MRDKATIAFVEKCVYPVIFSHLIHLSNWKSAYLNVCLFNAVNQCPR